MSRILRFCGKSIFEISDHFIKVVFPFSVPNENEIIANGDNNGDENRVLLLLEKEPNLTAKKISEQTGFSTRKISRIIKSLRETGKMTLPLYNYYESESSRGCELSFILRHSIKYCIISIYRDEQNALIQ